MYRHSLPIEAITVQCTNAKPESREIETWNSNNTNFLRSYRFKD